MSESPAPPAASASVTGGKASSPAPALPQKRYFRQRAHVNVLADHALDYPRTPRQGKWAELYPHFIKKDSKKRASPESDAGGAVKKVRLEDGEASASTPVEDDGAPEIVDELDLVAEEDVKKVEFADIGCGYGGLLMELAPLFPDTLMLGMEIRTKVTDYVAHKIRALRAKAREEGTVAYENIAVLRGNAMKYMANFFEKGQLKKIFFLYPDPNFKRRTHSRRIISPNLLSEYAFHLAIGGLLYTCTDVLALHEWMVDKLDKHPLFERLPEEEVEKDPCRAAVWGGTEEGKKVERNGGGKWMSIWRRIEA